jgi:hypothetical protein
VSHQIAPRHRLLTLVPPPATPKQHLFKHKRCACRPCNLAVSCSCSTPTLQSRVCDPLTAGKLDIGEWDAETVWRASHCDRPRSSYSSKGYASHTPMCAGGAKDGFPCTSSADCGPGGYCDGHCPSLLIDRWRLIENIVCCLVLVVVGVLRDRNPSRCKTGRGMLVPFRVAGTLVASPSR